MGSRSRREAQLPHTSHDLQAIFDHGWRDAEDGKSLSANPYLRDESNYRLSAWVEGYREFADGMSAAYRDRLVDEGKQAGTLLLDNRACPYILDQSSLRYDAWLSGYQSPGAQ